MVRLSLFMYTGSNPQRDSWVLALLSFKGLCRRCERLELLGEIPLVQTADSYLEAVLTEDDDIGWKMAVIASETRHFPSVAASHNGIQSPISGSSLTEEGSYVFNS